MGDVVDIRGLAPPSRAPTLHGGGGDGTSGGMETRVAVLEANVRHIRDDVAELRADMRGVKSDIGQLRTSYGELRTDLAVLRATAATRGFVVAVVVGTGAVLGAITTFAPFIQRLLGLAR